MSNAVYHFVDGSLWGLLPDFGTYILPSYTTFTSVVDSQALQVFYDQSIQQSGIVYAGALLALTMNFLSAAWVVVQGTEAVAARSGDFFESYYYTYGGASEIGNQVGLYEVISFVAYAVFSLTTTLVSLWFTSNIWAAMDQRAIDVVNDGQGGIVIDPVTAGKLFTLMLISGYMSVVGGFGLGDVADQLLTWWDSYGETKKTWNEGTDKEDRDQIGRDGNAARFDFAYHYTVLASGYLVFATISAGGFWFMNNFAKFNDEYTCDWDPPVDKAKMLSLFQQILTSKENCYTYIPEMLKVMDYNHNGFIDRCEDAFLSKSLGNSEAYALKFANILPLTAYKGRCDQIFNPLF